jgi:hypothetical protein
MFITLAFFCAFAQDTNAMSKALITLYEQIAFVDAYKTYCDTAAPDSTLVNTQAVNAWKTDNNVSHVEQLVTQFSALSPDIAQAFQSTGAAFQAQFTERFAGIEAEACEDLPRLLQGEEANLTALYPREMQLLPSIAEALGQANSSQTNSEQTNSEQNANPLANPQTNAQITTPPPSGTSSLSGLYVSYETGSGFDGTGFVPNGPDLWYFFSDGYVYKGDLAHQSIDCKVATKDDGTPLCDTYVITADTITFSDGETRSFLNTGQRLEIAGQSWFYSPPESFTLEGSYGRTSGNSSVLSNTTIIFRADGTFSWENASGVNLVDEQKVGTADGIETTTTSVTDFNESSNSGTYLIADNSITFTFSDGTVKSYAFDYLEDEEGGVEGVYLGSTPYY